MSTDAIREALGASQEAWQAAAEEYPSDDSDRRAALLLSLDNAISELEDALRIAGGTEED